ncbi:transmembrane protein, putative, partial [Bodo saltans]
GRPKTMREVSKVPKPSTGYMMFAAFGFISGGLLFSQSVTLESPSFKLSTADDYYCGAHLKEAYKQNVQQLRNDSDEALRAISKPLTGYQEKNILETTIVHYLVPTTPDRLFGRDVVFYNGKNMPTLLDRADFEAIRKNWITVLDHFGVRECVNTFRVVTKISACDPHLAKYALAKCRDEGWG